MEAAAAAASAASRRPAAGRRRSCWELSIDGQTDMYDCTTEKVDPSASSGTAGVTAGPAVADAVSATADVEACGRNAFASAADANNAFDGRVPPSGDEGDDCICEKAVDNITDDGLRITAAAARAPAQIVADASDVGGAAATAATRLAGSEDEPTLGAAAEERDLPVRTPAVGAVFFIALGTWGDVFPLFCAAVRTLELVAVRTPELASQSRVPCLLYKQINEATPHHLEIFFATHACWTHALLLSIRARFALATTDPGDLPAAAAGAEDYQQTGVPEDVGIVEAEASVTCSSPGEGERGAAVIEESKEGEHRRAVPDKGQSDLEMVKGDEEEDGEGKDGGDEGSIEKRKAIEHGLKDAKKGRRWKARTRDGYTKQTRQITGRRRHVARKADLDEVTVAASLSSLDSAGSSQRHFSSSRSHFFRFGVLSAQQARARVQQLEHSVADAAWHCPSTDGTTVDPQKSATGLRPRDSTKAAATSTSREPVSTYGAAVAPQRPNNSGSRVCSAAAPLPTFGAPVASDTHAFSASSSSSVASSAAASCAAASYDASLLCVPSVPRAECRPAPAADLSLLARAESASTFSPSALSVCTAADYISANCSKGDTRAHAAATLQAPVPAAATASTPVVASTPVLAPRSPAASLLSVAYSPLAASKEVSRCCLWFVPIPSSPLLHHPARGRPSHATSSFPCRAEEIESLMCLLVGSGQQQQQTGKGRRDRGCNEQRMKASFNQGNQIQKKESDTTGCAKPWNNVNSKASLHIHKDGKGSLCNARHCRGRDGCCRELFSRCKNNSGATRSSSSVNIGEKTCIIVSKASNRCASSRAAPGRKMSVAEKRVLRICSSSSDSNAISNNVDWWTSSSGNSSRSSRTSSRRNIYNHRTDVTAPSGRSNARNTPSKCNVYVCSSSGCLSFGSSSTSSTSSIPNTDSDAHGARNTLERVESMADGSTRKRRSRTKSTTERRRKRSRKRSRWFISNRETRLVLTGNADNNMKCTEMEEEDVAEAGEDAEEEDVKTELKVSTHYPLTCVCVCNPFSAVWLHAAEAAGMARLLLVPTPSLALRDPPPGLMEALLSRYPQLQETLYPLSEQVQQGRRSWAKHSNHVRVREEWRQQHRPQQQEGSSGGHHLNSAISMQLQHRGRTVEEEKSQHGHQQEQQGQQQQQEQQRQRHQGQHQDQQLSSNCFLEELPRPSATISQRQLANSSPILQEQDSVEHERRLTFYPLNQQLHVSSRQHEGKRYRPAAEDCRSEPVWFTSTCTRSRDSGENGALSCTSASSSTQQPEKEQREKQQHLPNGLSVEGELTDSTDSRRVSDADAKGKRRTAGAVAAADVSISTEAAVIAGNRCCTDFTGVNDTDVEDEAASDITREAAVAVARWAVQTSSRQMRLEDIRHWHWRLCLNDHDAFRERILRIGPLLCESQGAGATAAANDAAAAASDDDATAAAAAGGAVAEAAGDSTGEAGHDPTAAAANDAAASVGGRTAAAGVTVGDKTSVRDASRKEAEAADEEGEAAIDVAAAARMNSSSNSSNTYNSFCGKNGDSSTILPTGSGDCLTPNSGRSSSGTRPGNSREIIKVHVGSNISSTCTRRSRWCPTTKSKRSSTVSSSVSSGRAPSRSRMPDHAGNKAVRRTNRSSDTQSRSAPVSSEGRNTTQPTAIPVIHLIDTDLFPEVAVRLPSSAVAAQPPQAPWKALETIAAATAAAAEPQETIQSSFCVSCGEGDRGKEEASHGRKTQNTCRRHDCENHAGLGEGAKQLQQQQPPLQQRLDRQEKQQQTQKKRRWQRNQQQQQQHEQQHRNTERSLDPPVSKYQKKDQVQKRPKEKCCSLADYKKAKTLLKRGGTHCRYLDGNEVRQLVRPAAGLLKEPTVVSRMRVSFFDDAGRPCFPRFSQHDPKWQMTATDNHLSMRVSEAEQQQCWGQQATTEKYQHDSPAVRETDTHGLWHEELMSHAELLTVLREAEATYSYMETTDNKAAGTCAATPTGTDMVGIRTETRQQPGFVGDAAVNRGLGASCSDGFHAAAEGRKVHAVGTTEEAQQRDGLGISHRSQQQQQNTRTAVQHALLSRNRKEKSEERRGRTALFEGVCEGFDTQEDSCETAGVHIETMRRSACNEYHSSKTSERGHGSLYSRGSSLTELSMQQQINRSMIEGMRVDDETAGWLVYVSFGSMHAQELGLLPSVACLAQALAHVGVFLKKHVLLHVPFSSFDATSSLNTAAVAEERAAAARAAAAPSFSEKDEKLFCRGTGLCQCARQEDSSPGASSSWRVLVLRSVTDIPLLVKDSLIIDGDDKRQRTAQVADPQSLQELATVPEREVCVPVRGAAAVAMKRRAAASNNTVFKAAAAGVTNTAASASSGEICYKEIEVPQADASGEWTVGRRAQHEAACKDVLSQVTTGGEDWIKDMIAASEEAAEEALEKKDIVGASVGDGRDTHKAIYDTQKAVLRCREEACTRRVVRRRSEGREEATNACEDCQAGVPPPTGRVDGRASYSTSVAEKVGTKRSILPERGILPRSLEKAAALQDSTGCVLRNETSPPCGVDGVSARIRTIKRGNQCGGVKRAADVFYVDRDRRTHIEAEDTTINVEGVSEGSAMERCVLGEMEDVNVLQKARGIRRLFCLLTHASAGSAWLLKELRTVVICLLPVMMAAATFIPLIMREGIPADGSRRCCRFRQQIHRRRENDYFRAPSSTAFRCSAVPLLSSSYSRGGQATSQQQQQRLHTMPWKRRRPSLRREQTSRERPGIPWLVFPFFYDQPIIARRLAARGLATVASESLLDCLDETATIETKLKAQKREWMLRSQAEQQLRSALKTTEEDARHTTFQPDMPREIGQTCPPSTDREVDEKGWKETNSEKRRTAFTSMTTTIEKSPCQIDTTIGGETYAYEIDRSQKETYGFVSSGTFTKTENTSSPVARETSESGLYLPAYSKDTYTSPRVVVDDLPSANKAHSANQQESEDRQLNIQLIRVLESRLTRLQQKLVRLLLTEIRAALWQKQRACAGQDAKEVLATTETKAFGSHAEAPEAEAATAAAQEDNIPRCISAVGEYDSRRHATPQVKLQRTDTHGKGTALGRAPEQAGQSNSNTQAQATDVESLRNSAAAHMDVVPVGETGVRVVHEDGARVAAWALLALLFQQQQRQGSPSAVQLGSRM